MSKHHRQLSPALPLEPSIVHGAPAAFDSVRDEIAAVPADALAVINVEILRAARRGLAVAERLIPLMPELAKLHDLDLRAIERLRTYALALIHAQALVELSEVKATPLSVLVREATPLRANLMATVEMLAHFGLVSAGRVATIRRGKGFVDLADALLALALVLRGAWHQVEGKVCVSRADVDRAVALSAALSKALGIRESDTEPRVEPSGPRFVRAQAYTLFVRTYDECRRAVTYLRWRQGDALQIVPPLRPRRTAHRSMGVPLDADDGSTAERDPSSLRLASPAA